MNDIYKLRREPDIVEKLSKNSLLRFYKNMYSECGQDGILEYIFQKCGINNGVFVEFGAWDGIHLSNCRALTFKGWTGVSIECDSERFVKLESNITNGSKAILARVGIGSNNHDKLLMDILNENDVSINEIKFLSIDVDGCDLEIFESLQFAPPVVLVEGGFNYNPTIDSKVSTEYAFKNNQHPLSAVIKSAETAGYKAVCFFQDTYLVRSDYAISFKEQISMSARELYSDAWNFASDELRQYLINYRNSDEYLIEFEKKHLGYFSENPTSV